MKNNDKKDTKKQQESERHIKEREAWRKLCQFANHSINFVDGRINFDTFYSEGSELFNLSIKKVSQLDN